MLYLPPQTVPATQTIQKMAPGIGTGTGAPPVAQHPYDLSWTYVEPHAQFALLTRSGPSPLFW